MKQNQWFVRSLFVALPIAATLGVASGRVGANIGSQMACAAKAKIAPTYSSAQQGFAVWLPGKAQQTTKPVSFPGGRKAVANVVSARTPTLSYFVIVTPLPGGQTARNNERFLEGVQKGLLAAGQGKLISSKKIALSGHAGREIVVAFAAQKKQVHTRVFVTKGRSYQAFVVSPQGTRNSAPTAKFFSSFQILRPTS